MYPSKTDDISQPAPPVTGIPSGPGMQYAPQHLAQIPPEAPLQWSTGLCDCTEDVDNCCITCWCPCITFGQIAEIIDRGTTSCGTSGALYSIIAVLTGCEWIYSCAYRSKLRAVYSLPESPCNDCLVTCCCQPCVLCQSYRELKNRGFDMKIGWQANMETQGHAATQPPAAHGGMMR